MSQSDEETKTILALYGCEISEPDTVRTECQSCGVEFWMRLSSMDEKLDEHGDACLQYCATCARKRGLT